MAVASFGGQVAIVLIAGLLVARPAEVAISPPAVSVTLVAGLQPGKNPLGSGHALSANALCDVRHGGLDPVFRRTRALVHQPVQ
ncbi:hypothetical protein [Caulobacter sp. LARHSG274]